MENSTNHPREVHLIPRLVQAEQNCLFKGKVYEKLERYKLIKLQLIGTIISVKIKET